MNKLHPLRVRKKLGRDFSSDQMMRDGPRSERPNNKEIEISTKDDVDEVAQYLADMTGQLETMARVAKLDLLCYLLAMAHAQADAIVLERRSERRRSMRGGQWRTADLSPAGLPRSL